MSRPPREFGEPQAKTLMSAAGMDPDDKHNEFFLTMLTDVMSDATRRSRQMRSLGEQLNKLTADDTVSPDDIAMIRRYADSLTQADFVPDMSAVRLAQVAMKLAVRRQRATKNLKTPKFTVNDEQIRKALNLYSSRDAQAKHLGLTTRQLFRRLKKLSKL